MGSNSNGNQMFKAFCSSSDSFLFVCCTLLSLHASTTDILSTVLLLLLFILDLLLLASNQLLLYLYLCSIYIHCILDSYSYYAQQQSSIHPSVSYHRVSILLAWTKQYTYTTLHENLHGHVYSLKTLQQIRCCCCCLINPYPFSPPSPITLHPLCTRTKY